MFEQDYLVRMFVQFAEAIRRSWEKNEEERDPSGAADLLESAISNATDIDGSMLLSLAPGSFAGVLKVSGTDPRVVDYISRSLLLSSEYRHDAGDQTCADLRREQAFALAHEYGIDLSDASSARDEMEAFIENVGEDNK